MKAAVFRKEPISLSIEEMDIPNPGPDELLLRVIACGICGSDLHAVAEDYVPLGTVLGHEFAGEVVRAGSAVAEQWQPGERVVAIPSIPCGHCEDCVNKDLARCSEPVTVGLSTEYSGAYAQYTRVHAGLALKIPEAVSWQAAAVIEPLAVGLGALQQASISYGDQVLIIGAGPIGLAIAQWARFFGAGHIAVSEKHAVRLQRAKAAGANLLIDANTDSDPVAAFKQQTGSEPTLIFECVGLPGIVQQLIDMAPREARLVLVGAGIAPEAFSVLSAAMKRLQMVFAYGYSLEEYRFILDMISAGRIATDFLVSHSFPLEQLPDEFEKLKKPNEHCKVLVLP